MSKQSNYNNNEELLFQQKELQSNKLMADLLKRKQKFLKLIQGDYDN